MNLHLTEFDRSLITDPQQVRTWKTVMRGWHEARMRELGYPPGVQAELRKGREQWLARCPDDIE